jgi:hypothetical protein
VTARLRRVFSQLGLAQPSTPWRFFNAGKFSCSPDVRSSTPHFDITTTKQNDHTGAQQHRYAAPQQGASIERNFSAVSFALLRFLTACSASDAVFTLIGRLGRAKVLLMPVATSLQIGTPHARAAATAAKMEDRKRPAASSVDDLAPPSKRLAVNGASKIKDDGADAKEEAWIEVSQLALQHHIIALHPLHASPWPRAIANQCLPSRFHPPSVAGECRSR